MGIDVKYDLREITKGVVEWCDEVYPTRTRDQILAKLGEEFRELMDRPLDAWEMADLAILLVDLTHELGFDLARIIAHKMDINKNHRKWEVNAQGLLKHVKIARHPEGGDDQAVAHREHGPAADQRRASTQCSDLDARDLSSDGPA